MTQHPSNEADELRLANRLLGVINSSWMSQAICAAAKLQIADLLDGGPRSSKELAAAAGCHEQAFHQLLRGLCAIGICAERTDGAFEITVMGRLLSTHARYSMHTWAMYWGSSGWSGWAELYETVKTGVGVRERRAGQAGFQHLDHNTQAAKVFNQAMVELTRLVAADAARSYDFSGKRVADIGGGYGELLANILEVHADATGLLFDMQHAIDDARKNFAARGLANRCEFIVGDFFERVPAGWDLYILKSVIHDWNDERARVILETCRRAMAPGTRLLLLERLMPARMEPTPEHQALARTDLHMRVMLGACERTEAEFIELVRSARFTNIRCLPAGPAFAWIEATPG